MAVAITSVQRYDRYPVPGLVEVGSEGGWRLAAAGTWPTGGVIFTIGGVDCYSGVPGQGTTVYPLADGTCVFASPVLDRGVYDLDARDAATGLQTDTLASAVHVVLPSFSTVLYSLRRRLPPPRSVGPRDVRHEETPPRALTRGLWRSVVSAFGDTLHEVGGKLLGRTEGAWLPGDTEVAFREAHRVDPESVAWIQGAQVQLGGGSSDAVGVTTLGLAPDAAVQAGTPILFDDASTDMSRLKATFFLDTVDAEVDLDQYGRNLGLPKPFGIAPETWRTLIRVLSSARKGTDHAIEQVLETIAPGAWDKYNRLPLDHNLTYIVLDYVAGLGPAGRAYLTGRAGPLVPVGADVTLPVAPAVVSGIWDEADPYRAGTNYAEATIAGVVETTGTHRLTKTGAWLPSDEGKWVIVDAERIWKVLNYISANQIIVGRDPAADGTLAGAAPNRLSTAAPVWRPWMVGHKVDITSGPVTGLFVIVAWNSVNSVELDNATPFTNATAVAYEIKSVHAGATVSVTIHRATIAGPIVTAPSSLPASVWVDYATVPSAEVLSSAAVDGSLQAPFYLYDGSWTARTLLDLVLDAGYAAIVVQE